MNREFKPVSRWMRVVFVGCALTITVTILAFIDLLASERGGDGQYSVRPASAIVAGG